MEIKDTKEKIEVMQAYVDGEQIQFSPVGKEQWVDASHIMRMSWNWEENDYRIKPVPKYRPYNSAEEINNDFKLHGPLVKSAFNQFFNLIMIDADRGVVIGDTNGNNFRSYENLYKSYKWSDGTPCGVKIEE